MDTDSIKHLRIVVLGYVIRCPLGGMAWHYLQYVLGFHRLGCEVMFVEDSDDYPSCYDPKRHTVDKDCSYGLSFARAAFKHIGMESCWAFYDAHQSTWHGPMGERIVDFCTSAHLMLNISGANPVRAWLEDIPHRVFLDTDPVFEQVRQLTVPERRDLANAHNQFFTFGENIPRGASTVPDDGHPWLATRQPVVLDQWKMCRGSRSASVTTVMQWESYRYREYQGQRYLLKGESFLPYLNLPKHCSDSLCLALGSPHAPRDELFKHGWDLKDPLEVTLTLESYAKFICESKAEFTVAKDGYVIANTGWFSERSANYLASGRPVITQDTGFTEWMDCDGGVLPFSSPDEALDRLSEVAVDYEWHCEQARLIATRYFDSNQVLTEFLNHVF